MNRRGQALVESAVAAFLIFGVFTFFMVIAQKFFSQEWKNSSELHKSICYLTPAATNSDVCQNTRGP